MLLLDYSIRPLVGFNGKLNKFRFSQVHVFASRQYRGDASNGRHTCRDRKRVTGRVGQIKVIAHENVQGHDDGATDLAGRN